MYFAAAGKITVLQLVTHILVTSVLQSGNQKQLGKPLLYNHVGDKALLSKPTNSATCTPTYVN